MLLVYIIYVNDLNGFLWGLVWCHKKGIFLQTDLLANCFKPEPGIRQLLVIKLYSEALYNLLLEVSLNIIAAYEVNACIFFMVFITVTVFSLKNYNVKSRFPVLGNVRLK